MSTEVESVAAPSEVQPGFKVFVGNLSYSVDTPQLVEFFSKAGNVIDAIAIKRFGRPAGYGFVTFEAEEACAKAVTLKDSELEGRKLNVEVAIPRGEAPRHGRGRFRGRRGGRFFRGRGGRMRRSQPLTGEPSKTVIFVGNLPYVAVDQDLVNIFSKYEIESARVIRAYNGASRGFGFVTLKQEEQQAEALKTLTDVFCNERKLIIKPAISTEQHSSGTENSIVIKTEQDASANEASAE